MKCSVKNCGREAVAKVMCLMHYKRARKSGMPVKIIYPKDDLSIPLATRLLSKIIKNENGCLEWQGHKKSGYGTVTVKSGKRMAAHRASWTVFRGEIPANLCVLHKCDNRTCINPEHLFLGTRPDNVQDMDEKGRRVVGALYGKDSPHHKLNLRQVIEIRKASSIEEKKKLSKKFNIAVGTINDIISGRRWKKYLEINHA